METLLIMKSCFRPLDCKCVRGKLKSWQKVDNDEPGRREVSLQDYVRLSTCSLISTSLSFVSS